MIDFRKRGTLPISDSDAARIDRVASAVAKILYEQCETTSEALAVLAGASAATAQMAEAARKEDRVVTVKGNA